MRFKNIFIKFMSKEDKDKKKIKELKIIIQKQKKLIELLKERLFELENENESKNDFFIK